MDTSTEIEQKITHLFRHEWGKLITVLTKLFGPQNLQLAEDVVQDTLLSACNNWKINGLPQNPSAWLFSVARNKAIDVLRRQKRTFEVSKNATTGKATVSNELGIFSIPVKVGDALVFSAVNLEIKRRIISEEDLLVIYDDLDLPIGKIRLRQKGSAGGHNGIKSIIAHLGTQAFNRVKVGIDRPKSSQEVVSYVLSTFPKNTHDDMLKAVKSAAEASLYWAEGHDFVDTMNHYNSKK